ncbi:MAG: NAD(P)/FAD-dependent oxidoreductase [Patescibacteria group bacterium]|jgi:hypothetical protein
MKNYDLIVIGGGPAGMMAAGRAGENGARVLLLEKNRRLGAKLLITGKGRCNLTNAEPDIRELASHYGPSGKFLFSAFSRFDNQATRDFFGRGGLKTKVERGNRVFPVGDQSADVVDVLINYLKENKVEIMTGASVKSLAVEKGKISKVVLFGGKELVAKNYAICAGGKSYPLTGSDGAAYQWLAKLGHTIVPPRPALVPLLTKETWVKELSGLSLKNVAISVWQKGKKKDSRFGEALFTAEGLSGPIILDLSHLVGELLPGGEVELGIDFKPALTLSELDQRLQKDFSQLANKLFKNSLDWLLPQSLIPVMVWLSGINPEKKVNSLTREERKKLLVLLKDFRLKVKSLGGWERAIVTAGGVELREVDPKTLRSKIIPNLYLAGEILNLDGPTGGFNLQVCWSTGFAVGENFESKST